jgi:hypothetical protein
MSNHERKAELSLAPAKVSERRPYPRSEFHGICIERLSAGQVLLRVCKPHAFIRATLSREEARKLGLQLLCATATDDELGGILEAWL